MNAVRQDQRAHPNGQDIRLRILDAAQEVFAAVGYAGATTREIAARARIGKRMLFYYFPSKDAVYRAVLERVIVDMVAIHEQFRDHPGPVGLGEAVEGVIQVAAHKLPALKVCMREIMDGGPHLESLAAEHLRPLFVRAGSEVTRNVDEGLFRPGDPMHALINVGGIALFYFLVVPLLRLLWDRDPLDPATIAEHVSAARACLMHGLASPPRGDASVP